MIGQNFVAHNELSLSSDGSTRSSECSQPETSTRVLPSTVTKIFIPRNTVRTTIANNMRDMIYTNTSDVLTQNIIPRMQQSVSNQSLLTPGSSPTMTNPTISPISPTRIILPSTQTNNVANSSVITFLSRSSHSFNTTPSANNVSSISSTNLASPTKLYIRHPQTGQQVQMSGGKTILSGTPSTSNLHQIRVPGSNKLQYVRLVAPGSVANHQGIKKAQEVCPPVKSPHPPSSPPHPPPSPLYVTGVKLAQSPGGVSTRQIAPSSLLTPTSTTVTTSHPINISMQQLQPKGSVPSHTPPNQRLLLPAPNHPLPTQPGLTRLLPAPQATTNMQGYTILPTHMMSGVRSNTMTTHTLTSPLTSISQSRSDALSMGTPDLNLGVNGSTFNPTLEAAGARPRKPCNCTKSQCLKLYCDCFANGEFCYNCNCHNCANNLMHEGERSRAIKSCLDRNPMAFHPKIGKGRVGEGDSRRHNKGCNCKRSGCLKNYCECYEAKIMCSTACKCVGCKNYEESSERKTLMHLADAAEVRVLQQTAAKHKLSTQMQDLPSRHVPSNTGERLPYTFVTTDVAEATCACLLAQAEEAERLNMPPVVQERMVIEEFGRCLLQIIESANRTKASSPSPMSP